MTFDFSPDRKGLPRPIAPAGSEGPNGPRARATPIPFIVETPSDLRVFNASRVRTACTEHLCQVCGEDLGSEPAFGIPLYGFPDARSGFNGGALIHRRCLVLSLKQCDALRKWAEEGNLTVVMTDGPPIYSVMASGEIDPVTMTWVVVAERTTVPFNGKGPSVPEQLRNAGLW